MKDENKDQLDQIICEIRKLNDMIYWLGITIALMLLINLIF